MHRPQSYCMLLIHLVSGGNRACRMRMQALGAISAAAQQYEPLRPDRTTAPSRSPFLQMVFFS